MTSIKYLISDCLHYNVHVFIQDGNFCWLISNSLLFINLLLDLFSHFLRPSFSWSFLWFWKLLSLSFWYCLSCCIVCFRIQGIRRINILQINRYLFDHLDILTAWYNTLFILFCWLFVLWLFLFLILMHLWNNIMKHVFHQWALELLAHLTFLIILLLLILDLFLSWEHWHWRWLIKLFSSCILVLLLRFL